MRVRVGVRGSSGIGRLRSGPRDHLPAQYYPYVPRLALPFDGAGLGIRALRPKKGKRGETLEMTKRAIPMSLNLGPAQWGKGRISRGLAVPMAISVGPVRGVRVAFRSASRFPWL